MLLAAAINFLKGEGFLEREIQAPWGIYERPDLINGKKEEEAFYPDIMVTQDGKQLIFDIDEKGKGKIKKWKAFSAFIKNKSGEFFIIAPQKKLKKLTKIISKNHIQAHIIEIV